jgi:hypothetical protein
MTLILADDFYRFASFLGWNGFAEGGLEIARTPGTHETCRTEHVGELCQLLRRCLDRARLEREHRVADPDRDGQLKTRMSRDDRLGDLRPIVNMRAPARIFRWVLGGE